MKAKFYKLVPLLIMMLIFNTIFSPITKANDFSTKEDAISSSIYYSVKTHEIVLNEKEALDLNPNLQENELNSIKKSMENLSNEEIDQILINNGYDLDDIKIDPDLGHANLLWFVPIIIGAIVVAGGIIFVAYYFSHKEKTNLINKCYANKGYPKIDSRDKAKIIGKTNGASAKKVGGYKFECVKK